MIFSALSLISVVFTINCLKVATLLSSGMSVINQGLKLHRWTPEAALSQQKKAKGEELFDQIMYHLDIIEKDYFGLRFMDSAQVPVRVISAAHLRHIWQKTGTKVLIGASERGSSYDVELETSWRYKQESESNDVALWCHNSSEADSFPITALYLNNYITLRIVLFLLIIRITPVVLIFSTTALWDIAFIRHFYKCDK